MKIFVVIPTPRDMKELPRIADRYGYTFIYQDYTTETFEKLIYEDGSEEGAVDDIEAMTEAVIEEFRNGSLGGIISSDDYPGSIVASIIAQALNLRAPHVEHVLLCQHKYYARCMQQQWVPEAVPRFDLLDMRKNGNVYSSLSYPFFIKPVKSFFSCFAQTVSTPQELKEVFRNKLPNADFFIPYNRLMHTYTDLAYDACYMIAEELLQGMQGTIEGYVYDGEVGFFDVVDSIMFPGTMSFKQFRYPSELSTDIQDRVKDIARRCMVGMGFNNGMFNIEFFYNPALDAIHIIEINPRMASQFADLYEKVDGINSYEVLVAIASGQRPTMKKREGDYKVAASCVLREFENKMVERVPNDERIQQAYEQFPDLRLEIFAEEGKPLSSTLQDGKSYRYGLIHLGADSFQELEEKFQQCRHIVEVQFR